MPWHIKFVNALQLGGWLTTDDNNEKFRLFKTVWRLALNYAVFGISPLKLVGNPVTDKLQRLMNAAARLVTGTHKFDHGLPRLLHNDLHWLGVPERIQYKIGVTVHRCLQRKASKYVTNCCIPVSETASWRHLRQWRRKQFASGGQNAGAKRRPKILWCAPSLFSCAPHMKGHNDCLLPTERQLNWWSRERGNKSNGT